MSNPIIRITVDHIRQEIVSCFSSYLDGIKVEMERAVDQAIKQFNFQKEVEVLAGSLLREIVKGSLKTAFQTLSWDAAMRKSLADALFDRVGPNQAIEALRLIAVSFLSAGNARWCFCKYAPGGYVDSGCHSEDCEYANSVLTVAIGPPDK